MKLLSLDLSTKSSGYAVGQDGKLNKYGCITASSKDVIKRIIKMRDEIKKIIKTENINKIIMQEVQPECNSHTNKVLMWLQAVVVIISHEIDPSIQYEFIGASTWRAALKIKQGRGIKRTQLKPQDIQYVIDTYGFNDVNDDEADAICIFDAYWLKNDDNEINWE